MPIRGQSLELFFIDGVPDGMLTAEIFNWTGHVLMTPRIRLAEALGRTESAYTGIYILLGSDEASNRTRAYIGEAEDVAERLRNHDAKREWWTHAVLITSKANSLNKAHVKFLEARLVEEAKRAGNMVLENSNTPPKPSLSESATSNMEQFIDYLLTVLPAIRVDGFLVKTRDARSAEIKSVANFKTSIPIFELKLSNGEVNATAHLENGEFVVQPGSFGRATWIGVTHNYQRLFDALTESGVYVESGQGRIFSTAYAFSSPSAAGAVLTGRATAGPIAWVLASDPHRTYKDWEAEQLRATHLSSSK